MGKSIKDFNFRTACSLRKLSHRESNLKSWAYEVSPGEPQNDGVWKRWFLLLNMGHFWYVKFLGGNHRCPLKILDHRYKYKAWIFLEKRGIGALGWVGPSDSQ